MKLFGNRITVWLNAHVKGQKVNLKAHLETMELLIGVNGLELSIYTSYLIATFSVFIPIYFTLWSFNIPWGYFIGVLIINLLIILFLFNRIKGVKESNNILIEGYNTFQSQRGGSRLIRIDGDKDKIFKMFKESKEKFGVEISPSIENTKF